MTAVMVIIGIGIYLTEKFRSDAPSMNCEPKTDPSHDNGPVRPSADFVALIDAINAQAKTNRKQEKREDAGKRRREITTIFVLCFTLVALVFTYCAIRDQVDEMQKVYDPIKRQANAAEDTERRQLRAYLAKATGTNQAGIPFGHIDFEGVQPIVWASVRNSGQTPAYNYVNNVSVRILPKPLTSTFAYPTDHTYRLPVIESHGAVSTSQHATVEGRAVQRPNWGASGYAVYVYGTVFYVDAFKDKHWFNYCEFYISDIDPGTYCDSHNDSDDSQKALHDTSPLP